MLVLQQSHRHSGFTLIELVTVLVIISSLAVLIAPRFTNSDTTLAVQAKQLARDLRHIQATAMNQGRVLTFNIESITNYRVTFGGNTIIDPSTAQPYNVTLDNDITISGTDIGIDSLGRPVITGSLLATEQVFTLSGNSRSVAVTLSPVTGFVAVSP